MVNQLKEKVLVVIQLTGGNDFVNTIVPIPMAAQPINLKASSSEYPNLEAAAGITPATNMPTKTNISLIEVILVRSS